LSARDYVDAAEEPDAQLPGINHVVVAIGSGGTMAGLVAHRGAQRVVGPLAARTEGVFIDPSYTARALAGLTELVADGHIAPGQRTVFMHTGGLPGLFGHPQLTDLP